ncbi:MAG: hypothetical protein GC206_13695 [Alphaproteobacteria bacterium]|nr:hypothetical protein [Alphaproteobacteria bacterium]
MRATLIGISLAAAVFAAQGAVAQSADMATPDVLERVYACRAISDDAARLACFDAAATALQAAETAGEFAAVDRAQVQSVERDSFGFRIPSLAALVPRFGGGEELPDVELTVERVVQRANGYHAFVMTNGQVWVQVSPERARNVSPGDTATIRRAMAGSFLMTSSGGRGAHRVRREQ